MKYIKIVIVWILLSGALVEGLLHVAAPYGPHQLVGRLPYQPDVHVINTATDRQSTYGPNACPPVPDPIIEHVDFTFDHNGGRGNADSPVLVLGDSFVADGRSQTPFWSYIDAYGLGQNGAGPLIELALLKRAGFDAPRQLVILAFYAGNDLVNAAYESTHHPPRFLLPTALRWITTNHDIPTLCYEVDGQSVALLSVEVEMYQQPRAYWEHYAGWIVAQQAIRDMRDVSQAHGADFVILYIPTKTSAYAPLLGFGEDAQRGLLAEFAQREQIPLWDLTDVMRTDTARAARLYWHGDNHWNPAGHALAGQEIAAFLAGKNE